VAAAAAATTTIVQASTCHSAAYASQTHDQKCFAVSEVAADWQQLIIQPSIGCGNK